MEASCWVARKIFLSPAMASSRARTLDSRPTTNGVIMYGKMTTSRIGIIGSRLVSDFSFEVSIVLLRGNLLPDPLSHWSGPPEGARLQTHHSRSGGSGRLTGLF